MGKIKIHASEEAMNEAMEAERAAKAKEINPPPAPVLDDDLPGGDDAPPPAVKVEAFVRQHTGGPIRALTAFQAGALLSKAAPEERELVQAEIIRARPDLASVFDREVAPKKERNRIKLPGTETVDSVAAPKDHLLDFERGPLPPVSASEDGTESPRKPPVAPAPPTPAPVPAEPPVKVTHFSTPMIVGPVPQSQSIAISKLYESPTNPRKNFDPKAIEELAASIRSVGMLQPLVVRFGESGDSFEIVCGARRFRAAKLAGLEAVSCVVRRLTDLEVLEAQIVENLQRVDMTPLEEADSFQQLHLVHGYTVDQIAEKTGKKRAVIYARMKLNALSKKGRAAMEALKLPASHALLIARIPGEKLQDQALEELIDGKEEPPPFRTFAEDVQRRFTLSLSMATFDPKDDLLIEGVGACGPCVYRSGNCRDLTADIKSADVCTNPDCFERKSKADADQKLATLAGKGVEVIPKKEAKSMFATGDSLHWKAEVVELNAPHPADPKKRTWAMLIEKAEKQEGVKLTRKALQAPSGKILDVVDRSEAEKLIRKLEGSKAAKKTEEDHAKRAEEKADREATAVRNLVALRVVQKAVRRAEEKGLELPALRLLMVNALPEITSQDDAVVELAMKLADAKDAADLEKRSTTKVEAPKLAALLTLAAIAGADGFENHGGYNEAIKGWAKLLQLDLRALEKEERAAIAAEAEIEAKKKAQAKADALFEKKAAKK